MSRLSNTFGRGNIHLAMAMVMLVLSPAMMWAENSDALARPEFDKEMTIKMKDVDIVKVFQTLAQLSGVPFVLEFDSDPNLKVTINATNMVFRGVMASLASSYDLEYTATAEGIVVRRHGAPTSAERITLGAWPPKPGARYELRFEIRDTQRKVISRPRPKVHMGIVHILSVGIASDAEVMILDRKRSIGEREYVSGLELATCIKQDTDDRLDLIMELTSRRVLSATRYVETHEFATRSVSVADVPVVLYKTETGYEIILNGWSRLSVDSTNDGETESEETALLHNAS